MTEPPTDNTDLASLLGQIAEELSGEINLDRLLDRITEAARGVTGAPFAALGVLAGTGEHLVRFIHRGIDEDTARVIGPVPTGGGVLGELIRRPEPLLLDDLTTHPAHEGFPPGHPPMRSFVGVPIQAGGRIFGNLYLTEKEGGFTEVDLRDVSVLAAQAGLAIHAAELATLLRNSAVREERDRISRDLHDGVIQSLFSAGMGLEGAKALIGRDDDRLGERIEHIVDQLDDTIRDIRTTIFTLRPGSSEMGLRDGLVELAREYEVNEILRPTLNLAHALDTHVTEAIVPDVLNIVREALSNAAKHAGAGQIMIDARVTDQQLVINVRDTGIGFDVEAAAEKAGDDHMASQGLTNMAERAVLLDASLHVRSAPGSGTDVQLVVPLHPETDQETSQ